MEHGGRNPLLLQAGAGQQEQRFPLTRETMVEIAQPVMTVAVVSTCTALVLAQQGLDANKTNLHVAAVMTGLLFAYVPVGLFSLVLAVAVKRQTRLVGLTSGLILGHLLLPTVVGGVVNNVVKSGEEDVWIIAGVSSVICILTAVAWAYMCSYPKFMQLRRGARA